MPTPTDRPRTALRRLVGAALLLATAACTGLALVRPTDYNPGYLPGEERIQGIDMPVRVAGTPFAMPQQDFVGAVVDAMQGWSFWPHRFVPHQDAAPTYRVVLMFDPPRVPYALDYCRRPLGIEPLFGLPPDRPTVEVAAAFCRGDGLLAFTSGRIPTAGGPTSPGFREGVGQMTQALFPAVNPDGPRGGSCPGADC